MLLILVLFLRASLAVGSWSGRHGETTCGPCGGDRLGEAVKAQETEKRRYLVPKSFATKELSKQLVLIKVPETGSSTASNLLAELSERKGVARAWQGGSTFSTAILNTNKADAKWALGHQPWGKWIAESFTKPILVTTARDPLNRVVSHTEKRAARKEINCSTVATCDCSKGIGVALRFWGCCSPGKRSARNILAKYHHVWITERFNESLVLFALRNRLQLGDVMPPLAKYHGIPQPHRAVDQRRALVKEACASAKSSDIKLEREVHAAAVDRLDAALADLRASGVDIDEIISRFNTYLQLILDFGSRLKPPRPIVDDSTPSQRGIHHRHHHRGQLATQRFPHRRLSVAHSLHSNTTTTERRLFLAASSPSHRHDAHHASTLILDDCARRCVAEALDSVVILDYEAAS